VSIAKTATNFHLPAFGDHSDLLQPASSGHPISQKFGPPTSGSKVQPP